MVYDDDDDDFERSWAKIGVIAMTLTCGVALLWFVVLPVITGSDTTTPGIANGAAALEANQPGVVDASVDAAALSDTTPEASPATTQATAPETTQATAPAPSPSSDDSLTTTLPATDDSAPTAAPPADGAAVSNPTIAPATNAVSYPTLPDGSPVPVLAIYDGDAIALSGVVPSEDARTTLETLALANSKVPDATIINFVTIDPTVPQTVGIRVIEKDSERFDTGSSTVRPAYAAELDRVVGVMNALPHVTVLVIGHADQRGSAEQNYKISDDRAGAAANYLVESGISPLRVSSRPVGDADLLTLNTDADSLALNRRTEFVFYGILAEQPAPTSSTGDESDIEDSAASATFVASDAG